ncbi:MULTISPECIES: class I SAM-dependent DNA methyltransferase [Roseobacteraceae]|jgi:predicted TPR repeat methyltransferase|uniref:Biotin biosynthesis protein BioC n=1 Tax=Pseudosulfitobacter pseudonitzschiae TaxID=1402135 RepID=A0A221K480_9RHOB|nr:MULTISPECIES: class I SAM-dependent methyltransferase [Roseobacteraceae]ASM73812.1 biotin biosynthesis protein BioC [Pseudosulfitobacter pseudonitzschiae]
MSDDPDLNAAYALQTPEDSRQLYARWANTYDTTFASANGYVLHMQVASLFVKHGGKGSVLDVGAGTGLCGAALTAHDIKPVDATDISPEMLEVARAKGIYRKLFTGDILRGLDVKDGTYAGVTSSGTFTTGHVGPDALDEVMRVVRTGGRITLSINAQHFSAQGFAAKFASLERDIHGLTLTDVPIYSPETTGDHAKDLARVASWIKR